jgi:hypothetical protein
MTPNSIAGMAKLNGLQIVALTDHNTCGNDEAFFAACARYGVVPVAGMELTTSEDVHLLCLFRTLADAKAFSAEVDALRIKIRNRPEIFGHQTLMDAEDEPFGEEEHLLVNATNLSLEEAAALVGRYRGAAIPAHIDRESNGLLAVLGGLPDQPDFPTVELRDESRFGELKQTYPNLAGKRWIVSSDAHRLEDIADPGFVIELPCEEDADAQTVRDALMDYLTGSGGNT